MDSDKETGVYVDPEFMDIHPESPFFSLPGYLDYGLVAKRMSNTTILNKNDNVYATRTSGLIEPLKAAALLSCSSKIGMTGTFCE
jgi:hypothetical protein